MGLKVTGWPVVSELRAVLADDASQPRWIQTVQGKGYRFMGEVRRLAPASLPAPLVSGLDQAQWPGNLPGLVSQAIGRDEDLAALLQLSADCRLLSLVGPAGVGKTMMGLTLAQALRQQRAWPDGVWMIELAAMDAAEASISQLGAHLAHRLQLAAAATEGVDALATTMKGMALLLLLDNAEHVLPALAPLLGHLLAHVQGLHCVVTSREPLQLSGEQVFRLGPLGVPDLGDGMGVTQLMDSGAMRLFVDRVAERLPGFVLHTTQQDAAVRLCIAMDGLPLALELAAARVPTLGLQALAEALGHEPVGEIRPSLQLLTQGASNAAPHHSAPCAPRWTGATSCMAARW